jgi:GNAT superfamily N-acetyltransferase
LATTAPRRLRVPERFKVGITRYRPEDADDLAAWWLERFGPLWLAPERNAWLYDENPFFGDEGRGPWLCRRDGKIVGQQNDMPFDLQIGDEVRHTLWAVDLEVDEAWRLKGVGPALMSTMLERLTVACMLDLSDEGFAAFTAAGCTSLGTVDAYRRPLDPRRALHMAGVPAKLRRFGPVLVPALRLFDAAASGLTRLSGAKLVPVDRLDERVDEVWAAARPHYPVMAQRDLRALAYRIDKRPDQANLRRYYLVRRGRTLGYVVLRPTISSGERAVVVVDYLAPPRWVAPLLLAAGRAARRDGAVSLSVKTRNVPADRSLRLSGFIARALDHDQDRRFLVYCTEDGQVADLVRDPDKWFVTSTDSNLEIMTWGTGTQGD